MAKYSHSKLSTYEECPQKYKFHYIDGIIIEGAKAAHLILGGVVHKTLEKLYTDLKYQKIDSLKEILDYFDETWEKEWTEDVINPKENEGITEEHFKATGKKYIEDYYKHYRPFNHLKIIGLETQDTLKLKNGSTYHVRIDKFACDGTTYYVCDYKTDSKLKDQETADQDRQLAMYSIWVKKKFKDAKKIVLLWHMLAFDKEVTSERTTEHLEKLENDVITLIKEIESAKEFPQRVSGRCVYCEYKPLCPSFKHESELETKTAKEFKADDGVKLVDKLATLKEKYKEFETEIDKTQEDLIQFAIQKELEIVYGSNKKAKVTEYYKLKYPEDKEKIIKLLKKHKLYDKFININYLKLNSQILEGNMPKDIQKIPEKEKDWKVTLSKK